MTPFERLGLIVTVLCLVVTGCLPEVDFTPCTLRDTCPVGDATDADAPAVDVCLDATLCGDAGRSDVTDDAAMDALEDQSDAQEAMAEAGADVSDGDVADARDVAAEAAIVDTGPCPAMFSLCDGTCVDTQSNRLHCGGCGRACTGGQNCVAGACVCPAMFTLCGGTCVDPRTDRANCGACGRTCDVSENCTASVCTCSTPGAVNCGLGCSNFDVNNCGACGVTCLGGQRCEVGACLCPTGWTLCSRPPIGCADLQTSAYHCGACGNACASGLVCRRGACVTP